MTQIEDPDPYAELDYRADAGELSEGLRKPIRVRHKAGRRGPPQSSHGRIGHKP
jgi:hypothetical protein